MKIPNKNSNNINNNHPGDDENIEIENSGPSVGTFKNNKFTIVLVSALLIGVVIIIFFKKPSQNSDEKIEAVVPEIASVAPNDSGKSVFEFEKPSAKKDVQDPELLKQQGEIDIPVLPDLPEEMVLPQKLDLSINDDQKKENPVINPENPVINPQNPISNPNPANPQESNLQKNQELINNQINNERKILQQNNQVNQNTANSNVNQNNPNLESKIKLDPRYTPIIVYSGGEVSQVPSVGNKENIIQVNKNPISELKEEEAIVDAKFITNSQTTIAQGKLINAILETSINTEMPGNVRAVISRDIFGESGNKILIPRGSRLYGSYSSTIQRGQARVSIAWTRLIRPDGVSLNINFEASDQFGRAGIAGSVDNRFSSAITNSILSSILTVGGVAIAQKLVNDNNANNNSTTTVNQTQGITTTTSNATNQAIIDVTKTIVDTIGKIISNTLVLNPVIRIPQGTKITVIVNTDIRLPPVVNK